MYIAAAHVLGLADTPVEVVGLGLGGPRQAEGAGVVLVREGVRQAVVGPIQRVRLEACVAIIKIITYII